MNLHSPLPDGGRLYVVGDIHGRSDLLDRMVLEIRRDLEAHPIGACLTVTLGDYLDRGPDSRGVLERLADNPFPTDFVALKGNHEEMLATFLREPATAEQWRRNGGLETLHSYGIDVGPLMRGRNYDAAAEALLASMPPEHSAFLAGLRLTL